jgi:hypothetical protein
VSKVFSVRLPDEVAAAFEGRAAERSVKPTSLLREVVVGWLGDAPEPVAVREVLEDVKGAAYEGKVRQMRADEERRSGSVSAKTPEEHAALERERLDLLAQARATVVRRGV